MKPWPAQALLDAQKLRFSVCNIGPELFVDEEITTPQDNYVISKATAIISNNLKYRQLLVSSPNKPSLKKKKNILRNKSQDLTSLRRQPSEDGLHKPTDHSQLAFVHQGKNSPPARIYRQSIDMKGSDSGSRKISVVNVISLNEQAGVKKNNPEEMEFTEDLQQKFAKKYIHFKRTQNRAQVKRLGRFKSLAEIENRASWLNVPQDVVMSPRSGEIDENVKERSHDEVEGTGKKKRIPAFVGKINMSKCFTDREIDYIKDNRDHEKVQKIVISQRYSITDITKAQELKTLPTQENYLVVPQGDGKNSRNSSFTLSNTSREPDLTKSARAHPVKLPRLKSLGKRKDFGLSSFDTQFFSIGKAIVPSLEYDYKKKKPGKRLNTHNNSKSEIKEEGKVLKKSQSMNSSVMIEEDANRGTPEVVGVIEEPQEKTLLKNKKDKKIKPLNFETIKQSKILDTTENPNKLAPLAKPVTLKKSEPVANLHVAIARSENKAPGLRKSKTNVKSRNNLAEELVSTKLEGWGWVQSAEVKKRLNFKSNLHLYDN